MDIDGIIIIINIVYYKFKLINGSEIVDNLQHYWYIILFLYHIH